jgi:DNA-binding response OmpR family regulator
MRKKTGNPLFTQQDKSIKIVKHLEMKGKIVIADDDAGIRDIFRLILGRAGYEVEIKTNGIDILENKFSTPDIFIIDRLMSGVDGLDVCRFLKSQKKTRHIPVIVVSASPNIRNLAGEAGADDCLEKPFDMHHLLRMIEEHLSSPKQKATV